MKITYTATNRSSHYPYARAFHQIGALHAFISGFPRFGPNAAIPEIGDKLKRRDWVQLLYLASKRLPFKGIENRLNIASLDYLDRCSYRFARESDAFIYYQTCGLNTARRLKKERRPTLCVFQAVNAHMKTYDALLKSEYESLGVGPYRNNIVDWERRLEACFEADGVLCASDFVKKSYVENGIPEHKVIKVSYGFPEHLRKGRKPKEKAESSESLNLLFVGQLHYRKGLRYLIEAFSKLKHPSKKLTIVGPKTAVTGLEGVSIPEQVEFTGPLKGEALSRCYSEADVFILPSVEDGFGLVVGEALAFGLPIVVTSTAGASELITSGKEGFIVPPADSEALREILQQLADDAELRTRTARAAFESIQTLPSWRDAASNVVEGLKCLRNG